MTIDPERIRKYEYSKWEKMEEEEKRTSNWKRNQRRKKKNKEYREQKRHKKAERKAMFKAELERRQNESV